MNLGRSIAAAVTGLLLFLFLAVDLVLFGVPVAAAWVLWWRQ